MPRIDIVSTTLGWQRYRNCLCESNVQEKAYQWYVKHVNII